MTLRERVLALDASLAAAIIAPDVALALQQLARSTDVAEITGSLRFAGIGIREREMAKLVSTGRTPAGRSLEACNAVADYAAAAVYVAASGRQRRRFPLLQVEEIVTLHALATRRSSIERPGTWRTGTAAAQRGGVVPPPAWLVPRDVTALVERFAIGPASDRPLLPWLADFHARLRRIAPFTNANGRVARLCLNLLLARLRYPPLVLGPNARPRFAAALDRAAAGDVWPSALFFGRSFEKTVLELGSAHRPHDETLRPLAELAEKSERAALYKAVQRGRLRTTRKGSGIFTSKLWLDEYRNSRAAAGRPKARRPLV